MASQKRRIMVLGSTGSIGTNTLDVIRRQPHLFEVVALSCRGSLDLLQRQVEEFHPRAVAVAADGVGEGFPAPMVYEGQAGLLRMIEEIEADLVVNGLAGSAGLLPSLHALENGRTLALANKETYIMAGELLMRAARERGLRVFPVDSELSALYSLLEVLPAGNVDQLILTASGGAFRDLAPEDLSGVRLEDALRHPNWSMGPKITIDSATMANKGLEVIGAHTLFGMSMERVSAVIHPQCYIHAMVRTRDGNLYAQISRPDMRLPIRNVLSWPELLGGELEPLDLAGREMSFRPVDRRKYPLYYMAYDVCRRGGGYPIVYNAANEAAVDAFLENRISFLDISAAVEEVLSRDWPGVTAATLEETLDLDRQARSVTEVVLKRVTKRKRTA